MKKDFYQVFNALMVSLGRFELPASCLGGEYSIQLSYKDKKYYFSIVITLYKNINNILSFKASLK